MVLSLSLSLFLSVLHNCSQVFAACLASAFVGSVSVESEDPEHLWGRENNFQDIPCSNPITPMSKRPVWGKERRGRSIRNLCDLDVLLFPFKRGGGVYFAVKILSSCFATQRPPPYPPPPSRRPFRHLRPSTHRIRMPTRLPAAPAPARAAEWMTALSTIILCVNRNSAV